MTTSATRNTCTQRAWRLQVVTLVAMGGTQTVTTGGFTRDYPTTGTLTTTEIPAYTAPMSTQDKMVLSLVAVLIVLAIVLWWRFIRVGRKRA